MTDAFAEVTVINTMQILFKMTIGRKTYSVLFLYNAEVTEILHYPIDSSKILLREKAKTEILALYQLSYNAMYALAGLEPATSRLWGEVTVFYTTQ